MVVPSGEKQQHFIGPMDMSDLENSNKCTKFQIDIKKPQCEVFLEYFNML